ncbi:hypothetical protein N7492_000202 [Penicillium capsulatum]|uniref:Uncharacterized protein n=1 Tax=Penicillium capsulatum TaxID=69766 RepID=A0A9W9ISB9_9EURO|nr:hypothetical protein N7492_000202 [Penicillium capsulatum]KAJ6130733.1 hypothetical protein N7512_003513 [Penicillium capsulatum]
MSSHTIPNDFPTSANVPTKLSREGQKALRDHYSFVRAQRKHYGVPFEEDKFSGHGTALMKAALNAGKCDQVPSHIMELQEQMHAEWLSKCTPEQLSSNPDWLMQNQSRPGKIVETASTIPGLHHTKAFGSKNQVIFLGWNKAAVEQAANEYPHQEQLQLQEEDRREKEREKRHADYLKSRQQHSDTTPVGTYIVECDEIERNWPDLTDDLELSISHTDTPGVFRGDFDFGVLEGIMIICSEKLALDKYCAQNDDDDEFQERDYLDEDESEEETDAADAVQATFKAGAKRNAPASKQTQSAKRSKESQSPPRNYLVKLRCRETGEGMIFSEPHGGSITFDRSSLPLRER